MKVEKKEKVLKSNNGYITSSEFEQNGIPRRYIPELIEKGLIRKIARGLYIDNELIEDDYYILQKRYNIVLQTR